jgi:predicted nucleic acid-binding protein
MDVTTVDSSVLIAALERSHPAITDALVAATAQEANAHLVSRDQRAARTYEAIGVSYELIA